MGINGFTHDKLFKILIRVWPDQKCFVCGQTPQEQGKEKHNIFHLDRNDKNNDLNNLLFICKSCQRRSEFLKSNVRGYDYISMNGKTLSFWRDFCLKRDGNNCMICHREFNEKTKPVVDHIDNLEHTDFEGVKGGNLQLLCHPCNIAKNPPYSDLKIKDELTATMKVYKSRYRMFAQWLWDKVRTEGSISFDDAVESGAFVCKCSTETTKRYLRSLCSKVADFELGLGTDGQDRIYEKGKAPVMKYDILSETWKEEIR